jgi:predicted dehydrogenase
MLGEESHSGSHSPDYGIWQRAGGGSLVGKGCHPLTALLYLKRVEGIANGGKPIRPAAVTGRVHQLTRIKGYRDAGFLRTDYKDIEDYGWMHVEFDDGTVGDVVTGETTLGGIYDYVEVFANNHRTRCRLNPVNMLDVYNPQHEQMKDLYLVEKLSSNEGWSPVSASENFTMGYQDEIQDFVTCAAEGREPICNLDLAVDTMLVIYAAYLSDEQGGAAVEV